MRIHRLFIGQIVMNYHFRYFNANMNVSETFPLLRFGFRCIIDRVSYKMKNILTDHIDTHTIYIK